MAHTIAQSDGSAIAFLDIGSYSIRLLLVRLNPNQSYTTLSELKTPVRLGGNEFASNVLDPAAIRLASILGGRERAIAAVALLLGAVSSVGGLDTSVQDLLIPELRELVLQRHVQVE